LINRCKAQRGTPNKMSQTLNELEKRLNNSNDSAVDLCENIDIIRETLGTTK